MRSCFRIFISTAIAGSLVACLQPSENPGATASVQVGGAPDTKTTDPYTAESMKKALVSLISSKPDSIPGLGKRSALSEAEEFEINSNYLYVRFLPLGNKQVEQLRKSDSNLVLFDHPLDYRVTEDSLQREYHDPSLPDSVHPYFASVPVDYVFDKDIPHEILKPLFLVQPIISALDSSEGDVGAIGLSKVARGEGARALASFLKANGFTLQDLELAALELTGNLDQDFHRPTRQGLSKTSLWSRWRPSGTLKYRDTWLGDVPVVGVRVTAGYSYYWRSSRTNAQGYFSSPERWTYSVKYKAQWDADDFLMEDHESIYGADLVTEGPTSYSAWNRTFVNEHAAYSAIFSAAWNYYYTPIDGLNRPRQNTWTNFSLDLQISSGNEGAFGSFGIFPWLANWVVIRTKEASTGVSLYRSSQGLYGTTIHELAHSSHYATFQTRYGWVPRDGEWINYINLNLIESWARGVQWWLANRRYPGYTVPHYNSPYTGVIQDLIDSDGVYGLSSTGGDNVQGFTIRQIEMAVEKSWSLTELKNNLMAMYPIGSGPTYTTATMDALFAHWGA